MSPHTYAIKQKKKNLDIIYQMVYYVSKVKGFENEQG